MAPPSRNQIGRLGVSFAIGENRNARSNNLGLARAVLGDPHFSGELKRELPNRSAFYGSFLASSPRCLALRRIDSGRRFVDSGCKYLSHRRSQRTEPLKGSYGRRPGPPSISPVPKDCTLAGDFTGWAACNATAARAYDSRFNCRE